MEGLNLARREGIVATWMMRTRAVASYIQGHILSRLGTGRIAVSLGSRNRQVTAATRTVLFGDKAAGPPDEVVEAGPVEAPVGQTEVSGTAAAA